MCFRTESTESVGPFCPKITDFGLAKHLGTDIGQTCSGAIMGTPSYMAPEQALGRSRDTGVATDVYALGAILYEMLSGRPPFKGENRLETLRQIVDEEPLSLSRFHIKVSPDLDVICLKCLNKDPARRYPSAEELAEDLDRFLTDQPIHARRTPLLERSWRWCRRNPLAACLAAFTVMAAIGASVAAVWLDVEQQATLAQLQKTLEAEETGQHRLFNSLVAQARASRLSQRQGRRFKTLEVIAEATSWPQAELGRGRVSHPSKRSGLLPGPHGCTSGQGVGGMAGQELQHRLRRPVGTLRSSGPTRGRHCLSCVRQCPVVSSARSKDW